MRGPLSRALSPPTRERSPMMHQTVAPATAGHVHACEACAEPFTAKRPTKRFCSTKCRMKSHREGLPGAIDPEDRNAVERWLLGKSYAGRIKQDAPVYGLTVPGRFALDEWNHAFPEAAMTDVAFRARLREL